MDVTRKHLSAAFADVSNHRASITMALHNAIELINKSGASRSSTVDAVQEIVNAFGDFGSLYAAQTMHDELILKYLNDGNFRQVKESLIEQLVDAAKGSAGNGGVLSQHFNHHVIDAMSQGLVAVELNVRHNTLATELRSAAVDGSELDAGNDHGNLPPDVLAQTARNVDDAHPGYARKPRAG